MLLLAALLALIGCFGLYVGFDGLDMTVGRFNGHGITYYGWALALNAFALAAFFTFLWLIRLDREQKQ